jgi:RDD family
MADHMAHGEQMTDWAPIDDGEHYDPIGRKPTAVSGPGMFRGQRLAPFPVRAGAALIDLTMALVMASLNAWIFGILGGIWWVLNPLGTAGVWWLIFLGQYFLPVILEGESPGKMICKLTVIIPRTDPNEPEHHWACIPSPWRILAQRLAHIVDLLPLGAGFLQPLGDPMRQTWADKMTGLYVFWKWPHDDKQLIPDQPDKWIRDKG